MILVTGANGQLGRRIVEHLLTRKSPDTPLAVSVRDPAKAADLAARGVAVRTGDFDAPATLTTAFAGVTRLVLISTDGPKAVRIGQQSRRRRRPASGTSSIQASSTPTPHRHPSSPRCMPPPRRTCGRAGWGSPCCATRSTLISFP